MEEKRNPCLPIVPGLEVKYEPVQPILGQGPEDQTPKQANRKIYGGYALGLPHPTEDGHRHHRWNPNDQNNGGMHMREKFHEIRFKKTHRFFAGLYIPHQKNTFDKIK
ncbi:MAG: hypothetical protein QNJ02_02915 [Desulfobacterales bacterium]|nr:hypothetical protein [Desulfobacterales bacterium]